MWFEPQTFNLKNKQTCRRLYRTKIVNKTFSHWESSAEQIKLKSGQRNTNAQKKKLPANLTLSHSDDIIRICRPKGRGCPEAGPGRWNSSLLHMAAQWHMLRLKQSRGCIRTCAGSHVRAHTHTHRHTLVWCRGWVAESCPKTTDFIPDFSPKTRSLDPARVHECTLLHKPPSPRQKNEAVVHGFTEKTWIIFSLNQIKNC